MKCKKHFEKLYIYERNNINELNYKDKKLITNNSTVGLIWKLNYKKKNYIFKEFIFGNPGVSVCLKYNNLLRDIKYENIKLLNLITHRNLIILNHIVLDEKLIFKGILLEYLDNDWVTLEYYFSNMNINYNFNIKFICEQFLDICLFLNKLGFKYPSEHTENIMINIYTNQIKLIDIDSLYKYIKNKKYDNIREFETLFIKKDNFSWIIYSNLLILLKDYNFYYSNYNLPKIIKKRLDKINKLKEKLIMKKKINLDIEIKNIEIKIKKNQDRIKKKINNLYNVNDKRINFLNMYPELYHKKLDIIELMKLTWNQWKNITKEELIKKKIGNTPLSLKFINNLKKYCQ